MQEVNPNLSDEDHQEGANHKSLRDKCFIFLLLLVNIAGLITFIGYLRTDIGE